MPSLGANLENAVGRTLLDARKVRSIVARYRPRGWAIIERPAWGLPVWAGLSKYPERELIVPPAECNFSLWILLHECGHVHRGHFWNIDCGQEHRTIPMHVEEFEAENYAYHILGAEGLHVPAAIIGGMKWQVRERIKEDRLKGIGIAPFVERRMRRWTIIH